jgi:hypothetical protein
VISSTYALVLSIKILPQRICVVLGWEHAIKVNVINLVVMQSVLPLIKKVLGLVFQISLPRIDVFVPIEARNRLL